MPTFIKAGFWNSKRKQLAGELNLDLLIQQNLPTTTSTTTLNPSNVYKVYTALLNQTGTNAPIPTILENISNGTITWSRVSMGIYEATWSGGNLSVSNCIVPILLGQSLSIALSFNAGKFRITWQNGPPQDDFLNNYPIEFKFV